MPSYLMRGLYAAVVASLALVAAGPARAGAAGPAQPARADQPRPGATLSVAIADNTWPDLFYAGTNGQVWQVRLSNMAQRVPVSLGGQLIGGPAAVYISPGPLPITGFAVFGRGTDNRLWWRHQAGSGWSGWASLGGALTSRPTAIIGGAVAPGTLSVFVRGSDGAVWGRALHETPVPGQMEWTPWVSLGGKLLPGTAPASVGNSSGLFVAAVGTDRAVWVREQLAGKPPAWHSIGGQSAADPGLTSPSPNTVAAFVRGTDNAAWYNEFFGRATGIAAGWHSMRGQLTSGVTAVTRITTSQTSVFVLGTDNLPWANGWPDFSGWSHVVIDY
jgi:hypothetical protein